MKQSRYWASLILAAAVGSGFLTDLAAAASVSIPVANASFEDPVAGGSLTFGSASFPGWSSTPATGSVGAVQSNGLLPGTHLNQVSSFQAGGAVAQDLNHSIVSEATYTVEYLFGWGGGGLSGVIELYAGGNVVDGAVVGGTLLASVVEFVPSGGAFTMEEFSFTWTAPASGGPVGENLSIRLGRADAFAVSLLSFDHIRVSYVPIPEPSAVLLLLTGVGGLFLARRRRAVSHPPSVC